MISTSSSHQISSSCGKNLVSHEADDFSACNLNCNQLHSSLTDLSHRRVVQEIKEQGYSIVTLPNCHVNSQSIEELQKNLLDDESMISIFQDMDAGLILM